MAEIWVCKRCGAATNADSARLLLRLGWQLLALGRENGRRPALCPECAQARPPRSC